MIIFIEGVSQTGKTTLVNKYIQQYNNSAVRFKGSGAVNVGMQSRWQEYNFWMHNIIERINLLHKDLAPNCERSSRSLMILALKLAKDAIEQEKQLENDLHSICHKIDSILY